MTKMIGVNGFNGLNWKKHSFDNLYFNFFTAIFSEALLLLKGEGPQNLLTCSRETGKRIRKTVQAVRSGKIKLFELKHKNYNSFDCSNWFLFQFAFPAIANHESEKSDQLPTKLRVRFLFVAKAEGNPKTFVTLQNEYLFVVEGTLSQRIDQLGKCSSRISRNSKSVFAFSKNKRKNGIQPVHHRTLKLFGNESLFWLSQDQTEGCLSFKFSKKKYQIQFSWRKITFLISLIRLSQSVSFDSNSANSLQSIPKIIETIKVRL